MEAKLKIYFLAQPFTLDIRLVRSELHISMDRTDATSSWQGKAIGRTDASISAKTIRHFKR